MTTPTDQPSVLLIVGGGIAAYKSLELIRLLRGVDIRVRTVLTKAGAQFVTPLSLASLSGEKVFEDLFSLTDETEMGHIELSRQADLIVIAPATADLLAKAAHGLANDLASTLLLASNKPALAAPAMNWRMWEHAATRRNHARLRADGMMFVGPNEGPMACGETGFGRMAEPEEIFAAIRARLSGAPEPRGALAGKKIVITAGPTHEPIDPVRYIANRSSGKQGYAVARAARAAGAEVTLVSGPVTLAAPGACASSMSKPRGKCPPPSTPLFLAIFSSRPRPWLIGASPATMRRRSRRGKKARRI
jgi:phosphopantothenoylcysteine decarboxylase/phosphopantothenate--cysteine ligase